MTNDHEEDHVLIAQEFDKVVYLERYIKDLMKIKLRLDRLEKQ